MLPGFKSRRRRHMWVAFVVGSLPCSERFYSGFPFSSKTNFFKFHFCQESGRRRTTHLSIVISLCQDFYIYLFFFCFVLFSSPFCAHGALTHRELYFVLKVTEMVYVHSKMMIVDDNTVIIGSGIVYKYVPCPLYTIVPRSVDGHYRLMKTCSARSKRRDHFL